MDIGERYENKKCEQFKIKKIMDDDANYQAGKRTLWEQSRERKDGYNQSEFDNKRNKENIQTVPPSKKIFWQTKLKFHSPFQHQGSA